MRIENPHIRFISGLMRSTEHEVRRPGMLESLSLNLTSLSTCKGFPFTTIWAKASDGTLRFETPN